MPPLIDLAGQTFGRWTVLGEPRRSGAKVMWKSRCSCGTVRAVYGAALRDGKSTSCGCYKAEVSAKSLGDRMRTHGMSKTKEWHAYYGARRRCIAPDAVSYSNYGGRGIEFRFTSFEQWLAELGPAPGPEWSVDRIDVNGHYEPGNVRWATGDIQRRNQRCPCPNCPELAGHAPAGQEREVA